MSAPSLLRLSAVLVAAVVLSACVQRMEAQESVSPDGTLILRIEVDKSVSPPVADVTRVFVMPSNSPTPARQLIFKGSGVGNFVATWRNSETLVLSYSRGSVSKCDPAPVLKTGQRLQVRGCT